MNTKKMSKILILFTIIILGGCSLSPGMHMDTKSSWLDNDSYVFIESVDKNIRVTNINESLDAEYQYNYKYLIGIGDQIAVRIWGLPDIFPNTNMSPDLDLRRVDTNGNIFFPYAGLVKAEGKSRDELRTNITSKLQEFFNDPQVDISVAKFNSQQVFILGEVNRQKKINLTDIPISLSDAIGESLGLNPNSASGSEVFIIRQSDFNGDPRIYHADLQNPSNFIDAGNFYLMDNDIVYVNSSGTARWNRVISQFFPFSTFLNSIDSLTTDN